MKHLYNYFYRLANGRINRSTFTVGFLLYAVLVYFLTNNNNSDATPPPLNLHPTLVDNLVSYAIGLALLASFFIFILSLVARRLHDTDSNDIAFYSPNYLSFDITKIFKKGDPEKNKYGNPPKPGIDIKGLFGF